MRFLRVFVVVFMTVVLLASSVRAWAEDDSWTYAAEARTFGLTPDHHRVVYLYEAPTLWWAGKKQPSDRREGVSFSQPLVVYGSRVGLGDNDAAVIAVIGNKLSAFRVPPKEEIKPYHWKDWSQVPDLQEIWCSIELPGDNPTKSHPTLVRINNRWVIFIGTEHDSKVNGAWLYAVDAQTGRVLFKDWWKNEYVTDIVSAPTVAWWKGHLVVIATCGNTGRVVIFTGFDRIGDPGFEKDVKVWFINVGSGRTSSTPAVLNVNGQDWGFAVGLDQGPSKGELRVYKFDEILQEVGGQVQLKSSTRPYWTMSLPSGLCASFSTEGSKIWFGDSQSNVYKCDAVAKQKMWENDTLSRDTRNRFSNRSPALGQSLVLFPVVGGKDYYDTAGGGKVAAFNKETGNLVWVWKDSPGRVYTAPVVWVRQQAVYVPTVFVGLGRSYRQSDTASMVAIAAVDGQRVKAGQAFGAVPVPKWGTGSAYGEGVCGEIAIGLDVLAVTTDSGLYVYRAMPLDLEVAKIESGVPEGQRAKLGQWYRATVTFRMKQSPAGDDGVWPLYPVPVGGFLWSGSGLPVRQEIFYTDTGEPVPTNTENSVTPEHGVQMKKQGQEVTVSFRWTPPAGTSKVTLIGAVNINWPMAWGSQVLSESEWLLHSLWPEVTYDNNVALVEVPVEGQVDLAVSIKPTAEKFL
ncbi:MAG: hypothetical protein ACUVRC_10670, partial [Desulfotomaculales bacterium]